MTIITITQRVTCPCCLFLIKESEQVTMCTGCGTRYHLECWEELGGCATFGCPQMIESTKADERIVTYWGEAEKKCPVCAELIPVAALECPFCRTSFEDVRPMSRVDILKPVEESWIASYRKRAAWLLFFSAIGITSSLALIVGVLWLVARKERLRRVPAARALVLISIGIGLLYIVVFPLGWMIFLLKGNR